MSIKKNINQLILKSFLKLNYITILLFFGLLIDFINSECDKSTPILFNNSCELKYCTSQQYENKECQINNKIIEIQWLNNIIQIGELNFRYINFVTYTNDSMIIETSSNPSNATRIFYGLRKNGRPLFNKNTKENNSHFLYITAEDEKRDRFEAENFIAKIGNEKYLVSIGNEGLELYLFDQKIINHKSFESIFGNKLDNLRYSAIDFTSKNINYIVLVYKNAENATSSSSFLSNNIKNYIYFQKFYFSSLNFSNDNPKINITNKKEENTGNSISCFVTNTKNIICAYIKQKHRINKYVQINTENQINIQNQTNKQNKKNTSSTISTINKVNTVSPASTARMTSWNSTSKTLETKQSLSNSTKQSQNIIDTQIIKNSENQFCQLALDENLKILDIKDNDNCQIILNENIDINSFVKAIHLKNEVGVFTFYNNNYPYLLFREYDKDKNIFINYFNFSSGIELYNKNFSFNNYCLKNDLIKITENKLCYITSSYNNETLYIILLNIIGEDSIVIRYYSINIFKLYNYKILLDMRGHLYKNFVSIAFSYCQQEDCFSDTISVHFSAFLILSYPSRKDHILNVKDYLFDHNDNKINNLIIDLQEKTTIDNNIFGYEYYGFKIKKNECDMIDIFSYEINKKIDFGKEIEDRKIILQFKNDSYKKK